MELDKSAAVPELLKMSEALVTLLIQLQVV